MRHGKKRHILGVKSAHRSALLANLSVALIQHGRIETTLAKARALRPFIEKIITFAKKADGASDAARKIHFRRLALARVRDKAAVAKLFDERVAEFRDRDGGYTRIYKIGQRIGDAAEMALIELIDASDDGYAKPKKKGARKAAKKATKKAAAKDASVADVEAPAEEAPAEPAPADDKPSADAAEAVAPAAAEPAEESKKEA